MNYLRALAEGHGYVFNLARIEVGAKKKKLRRNQLNEGISLKNFKFFLHWIMGPLLLSKKMGFVISAELPLVQDKKMGSIYDVFDLKRFQELLFRRFQELPSWT